VFDNLQKDVEIQKVLIFNANGQSVQAEMGKQAKQQCIFNWINPLRVSTLCNWYYQTGKWSLWRFWNSRSYLLKDNISKKFHIFYRPTDPILGFYVLCHLWNILFTPVEDECPPPNAGSFNCDE